MRNERDASGPPDFTAARLLIQQRCLGTLAHELGNITSPVALVADVLGVGQTAPIAAAASTLRLVAASLARVTTLCRLLHGNSDQNVLAPSTIPDAGAWWNLSAPYAEDMLPDGARADGEVEAVTLPIAQYAALLWTAVSIARFAAITRPTMTRLRLTGTTASAAGSRFVLRIQADAACSSVVPRGARQLVALASWETRRVGGRLVVSDTAASLECRVTLPLPTGSVDGAVE